MKKYIHYGITINEYDENKVIERHKWVLPSKPDKGLWASAVNADFGWKDWCSVENFRTDTFDKSFRFRIDKKAKILRIYKEKEILPFVIKSDSEYRIKWDWCSTSISDHLDLERLYNTFDGMEVYMSHDYGRMHDGIFNSWDCDSVCVWNPKVILPIKS